MATNKLIIMNPNKVNILTDDELIDNTDWDTTGILTNEVAYSNRMNAILRQVTTVTKSIGDLIVAKTNTDVGSYENEVDVDKIEATINKMIRDLAEDKTVSKAKNLVWASPHDTAGVPGFRALDPSDIPSLSAAKITSGTFATARIADNAITSAKLASDAVDTNHIKTGVVTAVKLASNAVTTVKVADKAITSAKLANDTSNDNNRAVGTHHIKENAIIESKIATDAVTRNKIKDKEVVLSKLGSDVVSSGKILEGLIPEKFGSVQSFDSAGALKNVKVVTLTQAQYNNITKAANTLYFITT